MKLIANDIIKNFQVICENTKLIDVYREIGEKYNGARKNIKEKYDVKELLERIKRRIRAKTFLMR